MKAIQIKDQKIRVCDVEAPADPKAGEVLLKVLYAGFCGSDLNTYRGRNLMALNPVTRDRCCHRARRCRRAG